MEKVFPSTPDAMLVQQQNHPRW
eukprot:Gb_31946 [translate_table: standard]